MPRFFFQHFFLPRIATSFGLDFVENFYILRIRDKYCIYTSGENVTFLDTSYISLRMAKASSKQQHAVLAYVQQAVYSSNEQCSKQQQHHKQPYSNLQQAPALHNYYYCKQFRSGSNNTLLSILPYIA